MNDLIKRMDVVKEFGRVFGDLGLTLFGVGGNDLAQVIANAIPSAERKGEWIYCEDDEGQDGYRCSECGFFVPWYYDYEDSNYILDYKACPHCLARMKGATDGNK